MRRYFAYAILIVLFLTIAVWFFSRFIQSILPANIDYGVWLFFVALLSAMAFLSYLKDIIELMRLIFKDPKGPDKASLVIETKNLTSTIYSQENNPSESGQIGELHSVPFLPDYFVYREKELYDLRLILSTENCTNSEKKPIICLHGMAGIGKSLLAIALANDKDVRRMYIDGIFWLIIGQEPQEQNVIARLEQVASIVSGENKSYRDIQQGQSGIEELLRSKSVLMILDDVWNIEHIEPFLGINSNIQFLITSRTSDILGSLRAVLYEITPFSEDQALNLFANWTEQTKNELSKESTEIAKECGYLPLALSLVGALKKTKGYSWNRILKHLRNVQYEKIAHKLQNYLYPSLLKAILTSIEVLSIEEKKYYYSLAVFPKDTCIPEAALYTFWRYLGATNDEIEDLIHSFVNKSLINQTKAKEFMLHDLLHDFAQSQTDDILDFNNQLLSSYAHVCSDSLGNLIDWAQGPNDGYFFQHLIYHLIISKRNKETLSLLCNFEWMQQKIISTSINNLIRDYEYIESALEIENMNDQDNYVLCCKVKSIYKVLMEEELFLQNWNHEQHNSYFLQQFRNRSFRLGFHDLQKEVENELAKKKFPYFKIYSWNPINIERNIQDKSGHLAIINDVITNREGSLIFSASDDKTIKIWRHDATFKKWGVNKTLYGHQNAVVCLCMTHDEKYLVSGSVDHTIKLWEISTGDLVRTFTGHTGSINTIVITQNDDTIISGSQDCKIMFWDLITGETTKILYGHTKSIYALALMENKNQLISASEDSTIKLWNFDNATVIREFTGHQDCINAIKVMNDGSQLISVSDDRQVHFWKISDEQHPTRSLNIHKDWISDFILTKDERYIITTSYDKTAKVTEIETGKVIYTLRGHNDYVLSVDTLGEDTDLIVTASSDASLIIWNIKSGTIVDCLEGQCNAIESIVVAQDRMQVVSASLSGNIDIWDITSGKLIRNQGGHTHAIRSLSISANEDFVVTGSDNGVINIWDYESGNIIKTILSKKGGLFGGAITPDGKFVFFGSDESIKILNIDQGTFTFIPKAHLDRITRIVITSDGLIAISGSWDKKIKIWEIASLKNIGTLIGHDNAIIDLSLDADNRTIATASEDNSTKIWDIVNRKEICTLYGLSDTTLCSTIIKNRSMVISASYDILGIWNLSDQRLSMKMGIDVTLWNFAVACDGRFIILGDNMGGIYFVEVVG